MFAKTIAAITAAVAVAALSACGTDTKTEVVAADTVFGNTAAAATWHMQADDNSCALWAAENIIHMNTGQYINIKTIEAYASQMKMWDPKKGTVAEAIPTILGDYNVYATLDGGYTIPQAEQLLDAGSKMMLLVNGETIWASLGLNIAPTASVDHAVLLDEINVSKGTATLTDSGWSGGAAEVITIPALLAAWAVSGGEAVVTN